MGVNLLDFAINDAQRFRVSRVLAQGVDKTARELGCDRRGLQKTMVAVKRRAALAGWSPEHDMIHTAPEPFKIKGVSTLYGVNGTQLAQWVKTSLDEKSVERMLAETVEALKESIPRAKPVPAPKTKGENLLNCYVITDYHLGMRGWPEETRGEAWDTGIAEELLLKWFEAAISLAPDAETGVFAQMGDFLHVDTLDALTPTGGHPLDADSRYQKVVRTVIRVIRQIVSRLLTKHDHLTLIMAEGNHDLASSAWLRELFSAFYDNEPRVTVDTSPDPYYCVRHGATSLFFHHGHKRKMADVDAVFAAKFRKEFGETKHSYAHMGHFHHNVLKETPLMQVEQHRTLAAADAYASRGGWVSGRDAKVITYHREHGEVSRLVINPEMVDGRTGGD